MNHCRMTPLTAWTMDWLRMRLGLPAAAELAAARVMIDGNCAGVAMVVRDGKQIMASWGDDHRQAMTAIRWTIMQQNCEGIAQWRRDLEAANEKVAEMLDPELLAQNADQIEQMDQIEKWDGGMI